MLRIFEANFVVQILPLLMIAAAVILVMKARKGGPGSKLKRYLGISLASLPAGILVYIFAGMEAAAMREDGHFYSIPFGGYSASDNVAIGASILLWTGLVFAILAFVLRPRK
jgi:hypothetical protein